MQNNLPKLAEEDALDVLQRNLLAQNSFGDVLRDIRGRHEPTVYSVGRGALNAAEIDKRTRLMK